MDMPEVRTAGLRGRRPVKPPPERFRIQYLSSYLSSPLPAPSYPVDGTAGISEYEAWVIHHPGRRGRR